MELDDNVMKAALTPGARSVMLLGGADAGKSALAFALAKALSKERSTGVLDLDMGQAKIGPPTTVAWGLASPGSGGWEDLRAEAIYFTGAMSPPGNMLPGLTGAKLLLDRALSKCEKVVIDTTGFIEGEAARAYKQFKIDLLRPGVIIAVQDCGELEHILSAYSMSASPVIIRTRPSSSARKKSMAERAEFRAGRFKSFFAGSNLFEVDLKKCGLRLYRALDDARLEGRLLSFRDAYGEDLCLGVIEKADPGKGVLLVRTPLDEAARYASVVIGAAGLPPGSLGPLPEKPL